MTHYDELRAAAKRLTTTRAKAGYFNGSDAERVEIGVFVAEGLLALLPPADDAEPVSAPALRAEPGWTQVAEANCFVAVVGPDRRLRVWPNTGHVELVEKFDAATTLISGGATLGDVRVLAAVLAPRNKE